jgi:SAM-dependent methyltransferase
MFLILIQLVLIVISALIVISLAHFLFTGNTPSITTPLSSRKYLFENIVLDDTSVFYDLGCGNSKLLIELSRKNPNTKYVGVDSSFVSFILSKVGVFLSKQKNISLKFADFYKLNLSSATHIYVWIYVSDMNKLYEKFKKELRPGTLVYSLDFPFTSMRPKEKINIGKENRFGHTLYIYIF